MYLFCVIVESYERYYEFERNELFSNCMDTIRLIKYILRDPKNDAKRDNMIALVATMSKFMQENNFD